MPKLSDTIQALLARADAGEKAPIAKLQRGLQVAARRTPQGHQLVLHREDGRQPSALEAQTCGKHAGWAHFKVAELTTPKGGLCLTVTEDTRPPVRLTAEQLDVLRRVEQQRQLCHADRAPVLDLIGLDLMHVTPEYDRHDKCPYRLTVIGEQALRQNEQGVSAA